MTDKEDSKEMLFLALIVLLFGFIVATIENEDIYTIKPNKGYDSQQKDCHVYYTKCLEKTKDIDFAECIKNRK